MMLAALCDADCGGVRHIDRAFAGMERMMLNCSGDDTVNGRLGTTLGRGEMAPHP